MGHDDLMVKQERNPSFKGNCLSSPQLNASDGGLWKIKEEGTLVCYQGAHRNRSSVTGAHGVLISGLCLTLLLVSEVAMDCAFVVPSSYPGDWSHGFNSPARELHGNSLEFSNF